MHKNPPHLVMPYGKLHALSIDVLTTLRGINALRHEQDRLVFFVHHV